MESVDIEEGGMEERELRGEMMGRKYQPVVAHDRAVVEMSSIDPGSTTSSPSSNLRKVKIAASAPACSPSQGEQVAASSSPRDGDDGSTPFEQPKVVYGHCCMAVSCDHHIGIILSTLGAALQSLTGAPRLLAARANDDILPVLNYFKVSTCLASFWISLMRPVGVHVGKFIIGASLFLGQHFA